MKKSVLMIFLTFAVFIVFESCSSSKFEKIRESDVNTGMKAIAEQIGNDLLIAQKEGRFEPLGEEAAQVMRSRYTPTVQKESYETLKEIVGEFESMEYAETWMTKETPLLYIFRFKGKFSKNEKTEVRVVLDSSGKLAGFWVKPWRATLQ